MLRQEKLNKVLIKVLYLIFCPSILVVIRTMRVTQCLSKIPSGVNVSNNHLSIKLAAMLQKTEQEM